MSESTLATLEEMLEGPITKENLGEIRRVADEAVAETRADDSTRRITGVRVARALEMRGNFLRDIEETDKAKSDYFEALGLLVSAPDCEEEVGRVSSNLAVIHDYGGEPGQAKSHYERAISSFERTNPPAVLDIADLSNNLAFIYEAEGDFSKAEDLLLSALKICVETIGVNQEATAAVYNNIGTLYFKAGFDERAREMHMESLEARRAVFGEDHYETAQSHANLALVFVKSGEINAAKRHFIEALDIYEDHLDVARYSYETVAANFRDVLESLDDQRAIFALEARLKAHQA